MPAIIDLQLGFTERPTVHPARLHGAACALLESPDVRHDAQHKPFSVGPLVEQAGTIRWRLGWLADTPFGVLRDSVRFGPSSHRVLDREISEVSFPDLATGRPARRAHLDVISPLYFSRNGRDHPLPDPVLVLRSACNRWDTHAPPALTVPEECRRALLSTVYLAHLDGATVEAAVGATTSQTGFVGAVEIALTRTADDMVASVFTALMRFVDIAGVGAQTAHGFGAVRVRVDGRDRSFPDRTQSGRSSHGA